MKCSTFYLHVVLLLMMSCVHKLEPITYGQDECNQCKMMIVDKHYSCQLLTNKGKNYKFDAIECVIEFINENDINTNKIKEIVVSEYLSPGEMISYKKAKFLISNKTSSPMGANISAFSSTDKILKIDSIGRIYTWNTLVNNSSKIIDRNYELDRLIKR